jgi:hypothetical protein
MEFMARLTGDPKEAGVRAVVMLPQAASTNNDCSIGVELEIRP